MEIKKLYSWQSHNPDSESLSLPCNSQKTVQRTSIFSFSSEYHSLYIIFSFLLKSNRKMRSLLRNHDKFDLYINCEIITTIKPINILPSCLDTFHGEMPEIYCCGRFLLYNVMFPTITTMLDTSSPQLILKYT